jgi:hypothetical protein
MWWTTCINFPFLRLCSQCSSNCHSTRLCRKRVHFPALSRTGLCQHLQVVILKPRRRFPSCSPKRRPDPDKYRFSHSCGSKIRTQPQVWPKQYTSTPCSYSCNEAPFEISSLQLFFQLRRVFWPLRKGLRRGWIFQSWWTKRPAAVLSCRDPQLPCAPIAASAEKSYQQATVSPTSEPSAKSEWRLARSAVAI